MTVRELFADYAGDKRVQVFGRFPGMLWPQSHNPIRCRLVVRKDWVGGYLGFDVEESVSSVQELQRFRVMVWAGGWRLWIGEPLWLDATVVVVFIIRRSIGNRRCPHEWTVVPGVTSGTEFQSLLEVTSPVT